MYLLTGTTGFLGPYLLHNLLMEGLPVRALRRPSSDMESLNIFFRKYGKEDLLKKVEWVEGDLLDPLFIREIMQGISQVVHSAGFISFDPRDKQKLFEINMTGTANVVNAALDSGVERLLYLSSVAASGATDKEIIDEKTSWKQYPLNTVYGESKNSAEREVWRGMEEGLKILVLAPSIILGYGDAAKGGPSICRAVKHGLKYYPVGSHGYVAAWDVAKAMTILLKSEIVNEKYILSAENISHKEILHRIAAGLGVEAPTRKVTTMAAALAWRLEGISSRISGKKARITKEVLQTGRADIKFNGSKILGVEGFSYTPLSSAIEEMAVNY